MNEQDASLQAITTVQQLGDEKALPRQGFSCSNGAACSSRAGGGLRRSRAVPLRPGDEACSDDGQGSPRRKSSPLSDRCSSPTGSNPQEVAVRWVGRAEKLEDFRASDCAGARNGLGKPTEDELETRFGRFRPTRVQIPPPPLLESKP
jgi:hypothetical protein